MQPGDFLTVFNIRGIIINSSILGLLGVGMTFVIITGGIDLSARQRARLRGVVADKAMAHGHGQGWGSSFVGLLVALPAGLAWGIMNGVVIAAPRCRHSSSRWARSGWRSALAEVITAGVDLRDVPTVLVNNIGFGNLFWQIPTLSVIVAVIVVVAWSCCTARGSGCTPTPSGPTRSPDVAWDSTSTCT